jgi:hypothetical protein
MTMLLGGSISPLPTLVLLSIKRTVTLHSPQTHRFVFQPAVR